MVAFSCNRLRNPPRQLNKLSSMRKKLFTLPALSFKVSKSWANHQLKSNKLINWNKPSSPKRKLINQLTNKPWRENPTRWSRKWNSQILKKKRRKTVHQKLPKFLANHKKIARLSYHICLTRSRSMTPKLTSKSPSRRLKRASNKRRPKMLTTKLWQLPSRKRTKSPRSSLWKSKRKLKFKLMPWPRWWKLLRLQLNRPWLSRISSASILSLLARTVEDPTLSSKLVEMMLMHQERLESTM